MIFVLGWIALGLVFGLSGGRFMAFLGDGVGWKDI
jgi:hypothetical protein